LDIVLAFILIQPYPRGGLKKPKPFQQN